MTIVQVYLPNATEFFPQTKQRHILGLILYSKLHLDIVWFLILMVNRRYQAEALLNHKTKHYYSFPLQDDMALQL